MCICCKHVYGCNHAFEQPVPGETTVVCSSCLADAVVPLSALPPRVGSNAFLAKVEEWHEEARFHDMTAYDAYREVSASASKEG